MNSVLIVWNEWSEGITFFDLKVDDVDLELLKTFHNIYVNAYTENKKEEIIQDQISKYFYTEEYLLKFVPVKGPFFSKYYDLIVETGFIP